MQAWASLSEAEQRSKENFYRSQQSTAAGFMSLSVTTLQLLNTLTSDADIVGDKMEEFTAQLARMLRRKSHDTRCTTVQCCWLISCDD